MLKAFDTPHTSNYKLTNEFNYEFDVNILKIRDDHNNTDIYNTAIMHLTFSAKQQPLNFSALHQPLKVSAIQ